ncbi:glycosyl hydrolases family 18 protein, partial [Colletotrichum asianum]
NNVPAKKLNMGLGFYGRAFQLAGPSCNKSGCLFKGGATKGACSGESGILSYREIQEVIQINKIKTRKPVSKKGPRGQARLGGYLIWAIDQDNAEMSALAAVLDHEPLGDFKSIDKGDENCELCYVSSCGVEDCKAGEIKITDQKCGDEQKSTLCCPLSGPLTQSRAPGAAARRDAATATAKTTSTLGEKNISKWRSVSEQCHSGELPLTFSRTVLDTLDDVAKIILRVVGRAYPLAGLTGLVLLEVLYELDLDTRPEKEVEKWKNCAWYGKPGNCFDGYCPDMETVQITDSRVRTFCCESDGEPLILPMDLKNLFEHPPKGGSNTDFTLETDKTSANGDDDPNEAAFQFVVLVSPEALQISLDKRDGSHWDVFDCHDSISEGEHTIGLGHGVPGTILQMPRGCGPGKYAVAKSMAPALGRDHAKLLPRHLSYLAGLEPVVYDLTFDYDFSRDDYWDNIVAGRTLHDVGGNLVRWLEEEFRDDFHLDMIASRDLHEWWFGKSILEWLAALVKPEIKRDFEHKYNDGAVLDIEVESSFGFTLILESLTLPLKLVNSYLTFYNKGKVTDVVILEALARVTYEKTKVILNLLFPGASFKIPGIATIGPQLTVEGSIDASLGMAGVIETKLEIAKWEARQVLHDASAYKPDLIDNSKPSLDRTGDFSGIQKPEVYAGVKASGDVTFKLSAAAEFVVRFVERWDVPPAAAAVVGEVSLTTKFAVVISTTGACPFTYSLDVGARLFARATAPDSFGTGWSGGEVDLTDKWERAIIKLDTCPDLGPIPSKRSLRRRDPLFIEGRAEEEDMTRNISRSRVPEAGAYEALDANLVSSLDAHLRTRDISAGHISSLVKRGGVYGPAFSLPVGEFFCPSEDSEEGTTCKEAYDSLQEGNEGGVWQDAKKRKREEKLTPTSTIDENAIAAEYHAHQLNQSHRAGDEELLHILDKRADEKNVKACLMKYDITNTFPRGGELAGKGKDWGWEDPADCGNFNFGDPLTARAANVQYHTEHVLEAQMIDQFCQWLDKKKSNLPDPTPGAAQGSTVSFCQWVNELWDVPAFAWGTEPTSGGPGKPWTPIQHIAAQFPTRTFKSDDFVALESAINTPSKTSAWRANSPWKTTSWTKKIEKYADAKKIFSRLRSTMGSRLYQDHSTIRTTMKEQTDRIGKILDALDSTLLQANQRTGYLKWSKQNLKSERETYMKGQYTTMVFKTEGLVNDFLLKMKNLWASQAEKDKWKDDPKDTAAVTSTKKEHQNFIKAIEDFHTKWNALPKWTNPL